MKCYYNLWDKIITNETFEKAYKNAIKGKGHYKEVKRIKRYGWRKYVEELRQSVIKSTGTKEERDAISGSDIYVGFQYMQVDGVDTYPIWASAISGSTVTWVKADGTNPDA